MRVLVASDRGCIRAIPFLFLCQAGRQVSGLDLDLDEGCDSGPGREDNIGARARRYVRNADAGQSGGDDTVVCLAHTAQTGPLLADMPAQLGS